MLRGELENSEVMRRGYVWPDTGTHDSLLEAAQLMATLERRYALKVASPEELAFRNGWVDAAQLQALAAPLAKMEWPATAEAACREDVLMRVTSTTLPGVLLLEPSVFADERGFFMESFNQRTFDGTVGGHVEFVQDNHSCSARGVLRGLHYQLPPHAQGKLVRVVRGRVYDVAVDLRRRSPTFRRWVGVTLDATNHQQLWIPPGFAHGFLSLEEDTHFLYKTTDYYAKESEGTVHWRDPTLGIEWPDLGMDFLLTDKDARAPSSDRAQLFD